VKNILNRKRSKRTFRVGVLVLQVKIEGMSSAFFSYKKKFFSLPNNYSLFAFAALAESYNTVKSKS